MKAIVLLLITIGIFTKNAVAQTDVFIRMGQKSATTANTTVEGTNTSFTPLSGSLDGKAIRRTQLRTDEFVTEAQLGSIWEVGIAKSNKLTNKLSYRLGLSLSGEAHAQSNYVAATSFKTLTTDTINYSFPTGFGGSSSSLCDTTIYAISSPADKIHLLNLNLSAEISLNVYKGLSIGAGATARTPVYSDRTYGTVESRTEELASGLTACIYETVEVDENPINRISDLRLGLSPFLAMDLGSDVTLRGGVNFMMTDAYGHVNETVWWNGGTERYNALETYFQVSYAFGNRPNQDVIE